MVDPTAPRALHSFAGLFRTRACEPPQVRSSWASTFPAVALEQARARAFRLGITTSYNSASIDATGLDLASVGGAISIDVIWAVPDKRAGFAEIARILRPGARFVFADWECDLSHPAILLRLATIDRYSRRRGSRLNCVNYVKLAPGWDCPTLVDYLQHSRRVLVAARKLAEK
jgi:SAM-dependent methyltransferase